MLFNPGFEITPVTNPMGFEYGKNSFGPKVEIRTLDAIRSSLFDPDCIGPEEVYSIAMDVGKKEHKSILHNLHLLFGVVTYAEGKLGKEPVRSQGHIHKKSAYANGWSTPEVYEIWSGAAIIYMQETAMDNPGRCFAIHAGPGDVVIVPPNWAHATISANPNAPLTFGAWCDREYGFDYKDVRSHGGLAWFPFVRKNNTMQWEKNQNYSCQELIIKSPRKYTEFGLASGIPIYTQFEENPDKFNFVPRPDLFQDKWIDFVP